MEICSKEICTGCGMCVNVCPKKAIRMVKDVNDFLYPKINNELCCQCGICQKKCPANDVTNVESNVKKVYAVWNKNKTVRKKSTSGGVFTLLAESILKKGGIVAGVKWNGNFLAEHCIIDTYSDIYLFNGSKYVQSNTKNIYYKVKDALQAGQKVLFSGTPCQNHALISFLGKKYANLYQIDVVCHGVPSAEMLNKYLNEVTNKGAKKVKNIRLRYKNPYWDYCSVKIDFTDGSFYSKYTVEDSFYTLFNIGYSLRESCHTCKYTNLHRQGDVTLADFWGYRPKNFKMRDFLKGTSLILINSTKGQELFNTIKTSICYEQSTINQAQKGNRSLSQPFEINPSEKKAFWNDYEQGMSVMSLCKKYVPNPYKIPKLLWLRRIKARYGWAVKRK